MIATRIKGIKDTLSRQIGAYDLLIEQGHTYSMQLQATDEKLKAAEQARSLLQKVGLETQQQLQYHISDITSLALESVFDDPYELKVNFIERRNKTECDLVFLRNGVEISPLNSAGYGAVDIAAMALRVASWTMKNPRNDNVIILDEPFRFLSKDRQEAASKMIQALSKKLQLQFIIVTHEEALSEEADAVFKVTQNKESGISKVQKYETK